MCDILGSKKMSLRIAILSGFIAIVCDSVSNSVVHFYTENAKTVQIQRMSLCLPKVVWHIIFKVFPNMPFS